MLNILGAWGQEVLPGMSVEWFRTKRGVRQTEEPGLANDSMGTLGPVNRVRRAFQIESQPIMSQNVTHPPSRV